MLRSKMQGLLKYKRWQVIHRTVHKTVDNLPFFYLFAIL